jgi:hypothetical protein
MIIAVIEWNSDSGEEPAVFVADTDAAARRAVAEYLREFLPTEDDEGSINYIDSDWVREFPFPDLGDEVAVRDWLAEFREATTDAWLTLYGDEGSSHRDKFHDVRGGQ